MRLEYLMHQTLLVFEVVIELALAGSGGFDNLVRAGKVHSLLVKQVSRRPNYPTFRFRSGRIVSLHKPLQVVLTSTSVKRPPVSTERTRHTHLVLDLRSGLNL